MIAISAELSLEVRNCQKAIAEGERAAGMRGGFMSSSHLTADRNHPTTGKIVVIIPSSALEEMLADLRLGARRREREVVLRNDITEQFSHVAARIGSRQIVEQRYAQVLHTAKQAPEIMNVEKTLTEVRDEIDQLAAEQKELSDLVRFSTISVTYRELRRPCRCSHR